MNKNEPHNMCKTKSTNFISLPAFIANLMILCFIHFQIQSLVHNQLTTKHRETERKKKNLQIIQHSTIISPAHTHFIWSKQ